MPAKPTERQYRMLTRALAPVDSTEKHEKRIDSEYYVEGYASTFDDPYVLYKDSYDGTEYREEIDPGAFDGADMSDVIMQYDHMGHVFARQSNGTLIVEPDEHGLFVAADLGGSAAGRSMYEEIQNGLCTRMSWAFTVSESSYDRDTHTTRILKVRKVYDVSAVSLPADPNTEIAARNMLNGAIEQERRESALRRGRVRIAAATMALIRARKR